MDNKDFSNLGDQIRDSVQSAIDSMDFKQLNRTIQNTVARALDETSRHLTGSSFGRGGRHRESEWRRDMSGYEDAEYRECTVHDIPKQEPQDSGQKGDRTSAGVGQAGYGGTQTDQAQTGDRVGGNWRQRQMAHGEAESEAGKKLPKIYVNQPSRVAGILYTVFGGIGLGVTGCVFLTVLIVVLVTEPVWEAMLGVSAFLTAMFVVFGVMLGTGNSIRRGAKRLKLYLEEAKERPYCMIRDLAARVGKDTRFVIKDLDKMIRKGILPKAHLDDEKTYLMLDDETYRQYQLAQESLRLRQEAERERQKAGEPAKKPKKGAAGRGGQASDKDSVSEDGFAGLDPEQAKAMARVMEKGQEYLRTLREANEAIPGEIISAKLTRLETVIRRIFESVEKHPDQLEDLERFMEYYLPTTVKLVNAYRDFDSVSIQGENITMAKGEIEETLDTINLAFERLLDDLYQDAAFDASTDASVLQAMLKKDGWTESDFHGRTGS